MAFILQDAGHKVAVCEQLEEPAKGRKIVRRDVVRVITPGTITDTQFLDGARTVEQLQDNLGALKVQLSAADVATGTSRAPALPWLDHLPAGALGADARQSRLMTISDLPALNATLNGIVLIKDHQHVGQEQRQRGAEGDMQHLAGVDVFK